MVNTNDKYFKSFDEIVMYYDNGQEILGKILVSTFQKYNNFKHIQNFDRIKKKLFQIADMLTYIDKYDYKKKHKLVFSKSEKYFFTDEEIRKITRNLDRKRLYH